MPDWQTAEVQSSSPVRRLWTRCRKRSLSWLSFVSSGNFPHTANQIRSWTLTLVLKRFRNWPHPDTCPPTESAESIDIFKAHRRGCMSIRFQFLFNVCLTYFQCNELSSKKPDRAFECADIFNGGCFVPWWVVYFAWTCPAHPFGTAGTDGAGCVMDGWCSEREAGGCTVEAQSVFAPGVCARWSLLPFWTCKAASAAEEHHSSHKLFFVKKRERKRWRRLQSKKNLEMNLLCMWNV